MEAESVTNLYLNPTHLSTTTYCTPSFQALSFTVPFYITIIPHTMPPAKEDAIQCALITVKSGAMMANHVAKLFDVPCSTLYD